jgi:hypothetical protein
MGTVRPPHLWGRWVLPIYGEVSPQATEGLWRPGRRSGYLTWIEIVLLASKVGVELVASFAQTET